MVSKRRSVALLSAVAVCSALALSACTPKTELRGNFVRDYQLEQLKPGKTNKNDVVQIMGSPSMVGTFDDATWYYMSEKKEQWAFFDPSIVEHKVLVLYFDDNGVLQNTQTYTKDDMREVAVQDRVTPTAGHKLGFFEQLLGNIGVGSYSN